MLTPGTALQKRSILSLRLRSNKVQSGQSSMCKSLSVVRLHVDLSTTKKTVHQPLPVFLIQLV